LTNAEANPPIPPFEFIGKLIKLLEEGEAFTLPRIAPRVGNAIEARSFRRARFPLVLLSEPKIHCRVFRHRVAFQWQVSDALRLLVNKFDAWKRDQDREAGLAPVKKTTAKVGNRK